MKYLLILVLLLTACGQEGSDIPTTTDVKCQVVKLSVAEFDPVCTIECAWKTYAGNKGYGYATSTPVSCDMYGKKVTRQ